MFRSPLREAFYKQQRSVISFHWDVRRGHAYLGLSDVALFNDLLHDVVFIVRAKLALKLLVGRGVQHTLRAMPVATLSVYITSSL